MGGEPLIESFDPGNFDQTSTTIDNPWFPFAPGTQWVYEGTTTSEGESIPHRLEFTVTDLTKEIAGIRTLVGWIVDYSDGELVEKEVAFYAQDDSGTVWYLGEHPEEYEAGEFVKAPTWIHGIDGATAGIKMPADPQLDGPDFSQGHAPSVEFTDRGQVSQMGIETCVPVQCYQDVLVIDESNPEEPAVFQLKFYARGVGNVRVGWRGETQDYEELELVTFAQLDAEALADVRQLALDLEAHAYEISPEVYGNTEPMAPIQ
ncbi:MAG TPA: hypothetical protein VEW45_06650 [Candidatus Dormibacteraeota bacterium]|nr:hypothetical protein [Candidatus Dormibacteraeota bacterium]